MASVAAKFTFSCPHCDKVLKTAARPAASKKIKCPACGEPFVPSLSSTGIQKRPNLNGKANTTVNGKASKREVRPPVKKAEQKSGGSGLLLGGLLGCGVLVLLLGCGGVGLGAAFVWPGFASKKSEDKVADGAGKANDKDKDNDNDKPAKGPVEPARPNLATYVMADANLVMGMNVKGLRDSGQLEKLMTTIQGAQPDLPMEAQEIVGSCEKVIVSMDANSLTPEKKEVRDPFGPGRPGKQPGGVPNVKDPKIAIVALMSNQEAVAKLKALPNMGVEEKLAGKYPLYRVPNLKGGPTTLIAFPSDRIVVFGALNDQEMTALLDNGAKNQVGSAVLTKMTGMVEQSHFWAAYAVDAPARQKMQGQFPPQKGVPPALQQAMQAALKVKGGAVAVDSLAGGAWKSQVHLDCDDINVAQTLKSGGEFLKAMGMDELRKPQAGPPVPPSVIEDFNTLTFQSQGTVVSASMTISAQTITELAKEMRFGGEKKRDPGPKDPIPKEPFPKEPFPKEPPPKKEKLLPSPMGKTPQTFWVRNIAEGSSFVQGIQLNKGQKIRVEAANNTPVKKPPRNNVDVYIYKGDTSDIKNIIAFDENPPGKQRDVFTKVTFDVPETGTYYIQISNKGPGRTTDCPVSVYDANAVPEVTQPPTKDPPAKDPPKINPKANRPPAQYVVGNFIRGHTDERLFVFQPGKQAQISIQFTAGLKKSADVEITVLKGETGNDVVARKNGGGPVVLQFMPQGDAEAVFRVRIHNRGPNTVTANQVVIIQQQ
jgi:hypothetical protein